MNNTASQRLLDDLHALERFLRGCRPGFGKAFAALLLHSLQNAAEGQARLKALMGELTRSVHTFVEADSSAASIKALELWSSVEHAITACRAAVGGRHRTSLAHGSLLQQVR